MHSNAAVEVSAKEAQRLGPETTTHLLSQRKLALVVDLDQTIIHTAVDPTVGEWMEDESNPNYEALKSVAKFRLGIGGEEIKDDDDSPAPKDSAAALKASRACWYYVKLRPGVPKILKKLSEKYQLHVYTMGTRSYANLVCKLIDPDASIFGNRIVSRNENGSLVRKSLDKLFPMDHSMVVIIDDREDVWSKSPNLLQVVPYEFFVGVGDINAPILPPTLAPPGAAGIVAQTEKLQSKLAEQREARPLAKMQEALDEKLGKTNGSGSRSGTAMPDGSDSATPADESSTEAESSDAVAAQTTADSPTAEEKTQATESISHAVLVDDDTELDRVYSILDSIHNEWYSAYDKLQSQTPTPTTKPSVVDFISARKTKVLAGCTIVFYPETSELWALAREFGATPAFKEEAGVTTHVISALQDDIGTVKATRLARAGMVELVWPSWFDISTSRWERQDEALYRLPREHAILDALGWT